MVGFALVFLGVVLRLVGLFPVTGWFIDSLGLVPVLFGAGSIFN